MRQLELQPYAAHVQALENLTPPTGGDVCIVNVPGDDHTMIICGDRAGLIRLSTAILKYAVDARLEEERLAAPTTYLSDWFSATSDCTHLALKIVERRPVEQVSHRRSRAYVAGLLIQRLLSGARTVLRRARFT